MKSSEGNFTGYMFNERHSLQDKENIANYDIVYCTMLIHTVTVLKYDVLHNIVKC